MSVVEVWYKYPESSSWQVYYARGGVPEVKTELVSTGVGGVNCWRASGIGTDYQKYQFFVCAKQINYQIVRPFAPGPKCWRFFGTGTNGRQYETFAAGENPSYHSHTYLASEGPVVSPVIDGALFRGLEWRYWPPGQIQRVDGSRCGVTDQEALVGIFADGKRVPSPGWFYLEKEPHTLDKVDSATPRSGYYSAGSCNCPSEENCIFQVLIDGKEVFSKTNKNCPIWTIREQQCPPGTCECRHSNRVCCYNSNGIIVKSFLV